MVSVIGGLTAIKTGLDLLKSINELVKQKKLDPTEIGNRLIALHGYLLDSREALGDAQQEIQKLHEQITSLQRDKDMEADLEHVQDGGFYVRKSELSTGQYIPYCPLCWGQQRKLIPLNPVHGEGYWRCDIHKSSHFTEKYRQRDDHESVSYDPLDQI